MRSCLLGLLLSLILPPARAQQPETPTAPLRLCVAQLRDRTPSKFDVVKLRQLLIDGISQTKFAKDSAMSIVPIEVAESEDALAAIQAEKCRFAVYTRLLQQAPPDRTNVDVSGGITYRSTPVEKSYFMMGVQCTVERTDSAIPVLIDRQFTKYPEKPAEGIQKVVTAEAQRIADAIEKKLSSTPK